MIRTLVVDDDFRVAEVHAQYVAQVDGFEVVGLANSLAEARAELARLEPDLMLLDLYLPDGSGLDLLGETRGAGGASTQVIVVTAARDIESVRIALAGGAAQYVVKPFRLADLRPRLEAVRDLHGHLSRLEEPTQSDIDRAYQMLRTASPDRLPKKIAEPTLRLVAEAMRGHPDGVTAAALGAELEISRATAQRYLSYLADTGRAELQLRYRSLGRPEHVYRIGEIRAR
ncbi:MAG TPA: response regulator [Nocardioidaceae bacterium]|nr:response regulator [Nocardioidaceae bacterium]